MNSMDRYSNFDELAKNEKEGEDFTIVFRRADPNVAVVAIHGGGVEPGTAEIANAVAGTTYTYYAFKGMKKKGNRVLHINSHRYDEQLGIRTAQAARVILSIHGCREENEIVFVGGRNQELRQRVITSLRSAGFIAIESEVPGQRGISEHNICNQCRSGRGVQLEISRGLRDKMYEDLERRRVRTRMPLFHQFVRCLRMALKGASVKAC